MRVEYIGYLLAMALTTYLIRMIPLAAMENTLVKTGEWYRSVVKN